MQRLDGHIQARDLRGAAPVEMALLPKLGDGGFRAFVRFPEGWSRPEVGHYAVAEEFLVLEGSLSLSGRAWNAGGHAWIPAFERRHDLASPTGCLVFAWFGGTPRWIPGEPTKRRWRCARCPSPWPCMSVAPSSTG